MNLNKTTSEMENPPLPLSLQKLHPHTLLRYVERVTLCAVNRFGAHKKYSNRSTNFNLPTVSSKAIYQQHLISTSIKTS